MLGYLFLRLTAGAVRLAKHVAVEYQTVCFTGSRASY